MIKECLVCKKQFSTYPSKIKLGRGKFCSKKCADIFKIGKPNSSSTKFKKGQKHTWQKGFRFTVSRKNGKKYKLVFLPEHPFSTLSGYVREHRLVAENKIGRRLLKSEIVHHKDGNTLNNDPSNLEVMDKRDHDRMNVPLNIHKRWLERMPIRTPQTMKLG